MQCFMFLAARVFIYSFAFYVIAQNRFFYYMCLHAEKVLDCAVNNFF